MDRYGLLQYLLITFGAGHRLQVLVGVLGFLVFGGQLRMGVDEVPDHVALVSILIIAALECGFTLNRLPLELLLLRCRRLLGLNFCLKLRILLALPNNDCDFSIVGLSQQLVGSLLAQLMALHVLLRNVFLIL